MTTLDDALARNAVALRNEFELTQRAKLPRLHEQVLRKARHRRITKAVGGSLFAVGAVVALLTLPISLPSTDTPQSNDRAVVPGISSGDNQSIEGLGFWPYVTEERSAKLCPNGDSGMTTLRIPEAVSADFVGEMLGWNNAASLDLERRGDDRIVQKAGNFPSTFVGGGTPASPEITIELSRIGDERCWWITGVSDPDDEAEFAVTVQEGKLEAAWHMPVGAEHADLVVVDSDSPPRDFVVGDAGATAASVKDFTGPGFAVVLWKGEDGIVFSAAGVTLPEGDYSATSP
jgi:hypothetical protein